MLSQLIEELEKPKANLMVARNNTNGNRSNNLYYAHTSNDKVSNDVYGMIQNGTGGAAGAGG